MAKVALRQVLPTQIQVQESDLESATNDGLGVLRVVRGTYDFAVDAGATGTITLKDEKTRADIVIPDNAVIWSSVIDVVTTVATASADTGTLAVTVNTANDIVIAVAPVTMGDVWDAGIQAGIPVGTAATAIKLTAARTPSVVIAGQVVTAGKFTLILTYFLGD